MDFDMDDAVNTSAVTDQTDSIGGVARDHLKAFVSRIERLEEDKKTVMDDMKEVYAEAKSMGFDTKILRQVIRLRKIDRNERQEAEALLELYLGAVEG
jgi:uncharacterized protein (UPF0335 family)|tara:strand:- start:355 stop:648 length:294 start_codon:yes stop_codon:yes gene_type:complete